MSRFQPQAALLMGGASARMGQPKQLLAWRGQTLGGYLAGLLARVCGTVVLVGEGPWDANAPQLQRIQDFQPGAGPLSALLGLQRAKPGVDFLVLATDLPMMRMEALEWLLERAEQAPEGVFLPRLASSASPEPLAAYYPSTCHALLCEAWKQGERSLQRALRGSSRCEPIPEHLAVAFLNANTALDWELALQNGCDSFHEPNETGVEP